MTKNKKTSKIIISVLSAVVVLALAVVLIITVVIPAVNYKKATKLLNNGEYVSAAAIFTALEDYKDAPEQILVCNYKEAERLESVGRKAAAAMTFGALGDYSDARERSFALWDNIAARETLDTHSLDGIAIKEDGTVYIFDYDPNAQKLVGRPWITEEWTDVIDIDAYSCTALKKDGTLLGFYDDWSDIVAIDGAYNNFVALKSDGTVLHHKNYDGRDYGQGNVSGWKNIVAVACGSSHTVGLRSNGTVIATGNNEDNQCDVDDWTDIVAISADSVTVGLKADGTVVTTDPEKDVSSWTDIVYINTAEQCIVGVKADGTVLCTDPSKYEVCSDWENISAVSLSFDYPFGLKKDGTLAYDPEMKVGLKTKISSGMLMEWTGIKQPKVRGFYDFDHEIQVDIEAEKNLDAIDNGENFRNKYGTYNTICAHPGCSKYIAQSGDTNCCEVHSNRCGNCNCYIDEDAMYCMSCIEDSLT